MSCCCTVTWAGYALLVWLAFRLFNTVRNIVYPYFIAAPISDLVAFSGGKWAVVTGSTDGIGKAYATELARKGFNIVLISRTQARLDSTKKEIEAVKSGVVVKTISYDFTDPSVEHYRQKIVSELDKLDIGVLVNNVGMSYDYPEKLTAVTGGLDVLSNIAVINTVPTTLMSAIALTQMAKRNKGVVINISSGASYNQMSLWAVYSATKKYVDWLSAILRLEFVGTGIVIQTVNPMLVATKMAQIKKTSFIAPGPDQFARSALRTVGIMNETNGCFSHQIQGEIAKLIPSILLTPFLTKQSIGIRAKALRKREREAKDD
uniref:Uncharacterized protein n=1 Tax=Plectus sambesii TaxID=2011161 RepID=A0A914XEH1_9BILA